jgi:2-(3-amino-3-carboxypropyl)histidine synthase
MIYIDEEKVYSVIKQRRPRAVAFNAPEALLNKVSNLADKVSREFGVDAYIIADPCYGSCDLNSNALKQLSADILFHIGHGIAFGELGKNIIMVDAYDDIGFESVTRKCIDILRGRGIRHVGLVTNSQHKHQVTNVKSLLEGYGIMVSIGNGKGQLTDAQVFGCEFYPAYYIKDAVEAFLFLGQSMFHAVGVALSTGKLTLMLDPYYDEVKEVNEYAERLRKRAILAVYKALDAERIGIVVGLKEGQLMLNRVKDIKHRLEKHGKYVRLIALTEVTDERLRVFNDIDAFIQVACPRLSIDDEFSRPLLSVPQAYAMLSILDRKSKGKDVDVDIDKCIDIDVDINSLLMLPHWL